MKASIVRITALLTGFAATVGGHLLGQEESGSPATSGGSLDAQTAILVIVLLLIVFGGLLVYEMVVRRRAR